MYKINFLNATNFNDMQIRTDITYKF